jgi:hypothetical protein
MTRADGRYEASRPKPSEDAEVEEDVTKVCQVWNDGGANDRYTILPEPIRNFANSLPSSSRRLFQIRHPIPTLHQSHSFRLVVGNSSVSTKKSACSPRKAAMNG